MKKTKHQKFFWKKKTHRNGIINNIAGFLFTVDGNDQRALHEATNILDDFVQDYLKKKEILTKNINEQSKEKIEDVSDVLLKMCENTQKEFTSNSCCSNNLKSLETNVKHNLFFMMKDVLTPESVYEIADNIVKTCQQSNRCRYLARILPIENTIVGDTSKFPEHIAVLIFKHFSSVALSSPSYAIEFRSRNSNLLDRNIVMSVVNDAVKQISPGSRVDLTNPDILICIIILKKSILLSAVKNYYKLNRFAIRPIKDELILGN